MRITGVCLLVMVMAAVGCHKPVANNLPPAEMLAHPGPGVDGPGPGVLAYQPAIPPVAAASQIYFVGPEGLTVQWDVTAPGRFDSEQLVAPARYNFPQGAMYRLKLTNIPGRPGVELFPTLEVGPAMPRTEAFLAHNAIPVEFTDEDFDQVMTGNFVTKVIYLPDPEFQEMALAGVGTLVSTRLDPGVDPIVEADRRGAIMAIVRLGNKDLAIASATARNDAGRPRGNARSPVPAAGLRGRHDRAAVRHAHHRHADRTGRTAARSLGSARRPATAHDRQPYATSTLPQPVTHERIDVKQEPGISYPEPVNHVRIVERTRANGPGRRRRPVCRRSRRSDSGLLPGRRHADIRRIAGAGPSCRRATDCDNAGGTRRVPPADSL